jgi:hypothetical protein
MALILALGLCTALQTPPKRAAAAPLFCGQATRQAPAVALPTVATPEQRVDIRIEH